MSKVGFVGFGEVNTPVEVIVSRAGKAAEALEKEGLELVKVLPVADDYEEVQIKNAIETLKKEKSLSVREGENGIDEIRRLLDSKRNK